MNIVEFLEARIAEDEALAKACLTPKALTPYSDDRIPPVKPEEWGALVDNYLGGEMGKFCAHNHPIRVLAECAAKRAILAECRPGTLDDLDSGEDNQPAPMWVARALAAVYRDHPDYQEAWG